jgi:hypothetical protein
VSELHAQFNRALFDDTIAENARLKAEVERLKNNCDYIDRKLDEELDKSAMLCGQVERLTKAGDWVMSHWSSGDGSDEVRFCQALLKWKNAKEGKQS